MAITVEELQILITAKYGDAIREVMNMVADMKSIIEKQTEPMKKSLAKATEIDVNAVEKSAEKAGKAVKDSLKKSLTMSDAEKKAMFGDIEKLAERAVKNSKRPQTGTIVGGDSGFNGISSEKTEQMRAKLVAATDSNTLLNQSLQQTKNNLEEIGKSVKKINWRPLSELQNTEVVSKNTNASINAGTKAIQKSTKELKKFGQMAVSATKKADNGFKKLAKTIGNIFKFNIIFRVLAFVINSVTKSFDEMALSSEKANKTLSSYMSSFSYLTNSIGAAVMPILEALEPLITTIVDLLADGINYIGMFIAALTGQKTYKRAVKVQQDYADSLNKTANAANKAKYALASFDEVNILDFGDEAEALKDLAQAFEEMEIPQGIQNLVDTLLKIPPIVKNNNKGDNNRQNFDPTNPTAYAEAVDLVDIKVKQLAVDLEALRLPEWNRIPAPVFEPVVAPAIDMEPAFLPSLERYRMRIPAPIFEHALAPAIDFMTAFTPSLEKYKLPITAPAFEPVIAPSIDFETNMLPSIEQMQTNMHESLESVKLDVNVFSQNFRDNFRATFEYCVKSSFSGMTQMSQFIGQSLEVIAGNVAAWGENVMSNVKSTMEYLPGAVYAGALAAASNVAEFVNVTSANFAAWGNNIMSNVATTVKGWLETFVGGLQSAWESFKSFMSATGEKISTWWSANKEPVLKGALNGALLAGVIATSIVAGVPGAAIAGIAKLATFVSGAVAAGSAGALAFGGAYANGGVITSPTLGLIGEYANAKSNPEIVTPQSLMYDTFVEANAPMVSALYDMVREIIEVIKDKDTTIEIDGDVVGSSAVKYISEYQRRTGKRLI